MPKIFVRLVNPHNAFKKDDGERFAPYETHEVEETDRIKTAISHNLLEKVQGKAKKEKEAPGPAPAADK